MLRPALFFAGAAVTAVALAALLAWVTVTLRGEQPAPPDREPVPVLYDVPAFELTSQAEQPVSRDDLRGKVWVANFIFTRCPTVCPRITSRMADIQRTIQKDPALEDVHLVSFSVDPHHDTPDVLRDYGQRFGADPARWTFLTGDRDEIWSLITDGFRLAVGDAPENPEMPIMHSDKFVLVDRAGRIRGYYSVTDERTNDGWQFFTDLDSIVEEPPHAGHASREPGVTAAMSR